jgi:hypothetical protein
VQIHIEDALWAEGDFRSGSFRTVGRLGGAEYIDLAVPEIFEMVRPKLPPQTSGDE